MRKAPARSPGPLAFDPPAGHAREERTYEFLTPVFGGGVKVEGHVKHPDPVTPIRVASIRGQLRFWWRACNPRRCTSVQDLARAEGEVFGSTSLPSPLSIAVSKQPGRPAEVAVLEDGNKFRANRRFEDVAYGAFPLRNTDDSRAIHGKLHRYESQWTLSLAYPEAVRADIEAALWAWASFGGIGGRTRRGFGAIRQVSPCLPSLQDAWTRFVWGGQVPWPHLARTPEFHPRQWRVDERLEAHSALLAALRTFRQVPWGRKPDPDDSPQRHPGRSYWPEPDAIRGLTGACAPAHRRRVTQVDAFPRAAFGMPIIFHFKEGRDGDPPDATLAPAGLSRLASPLVLRPWADPARPEELRALAVVLEPVLPCDVELTWKDPQTRGERSRGVHTRLTEAQARGLGLEGRHSPLVIGGRVYADPIEGFLAWLRNGGESR